MALAETSTTPACPDRALPDLFDRGLAAARALAGEEGEEHRAAWLLRLARFDPAGAVALSPEAAGGAALRCELLAAAAQTSAARGEDVSEPWQGARRLLPELLDPELGLHLLNDLCETAIEIAARDRGEGLALLRELAGVRGAGVPPEWPPPHRALALALLGEGLLALEDVEGAALLEEAASEAAGYAVQDQVLSFAAQAFAGSDPARAEVAAAGMVDPWLRLEARAGLLRRAAEAGALPDALLAAARADAVEIEEMRRCEALARLATVVRSPRPETAREMYEQAVAAVAAEPAQLRALQLAGTAAVIGAWDPDWSRGLYDEARAVAAAEPEKVRSIVARVAIAFQLGGADLDAGQAMLDEALAEARALEATWELAHVLELLFDPRERPALDLSGGAPLLDAALARVGDDDLRLPGVFGLPEIARCYRVLDSERAAAVCRRWFTAAQRAYDPDGMLEAALAIQQVEPAAGGGALRNAATTMVERLDCSGLSRFCQAAAGAAPGLAALVARRIPESRERTRGLAAAAAGAWESDPAEALSLIEEIAEPAERSAALLAVADRCLGTGELPRPVTESEFNSCCSGIPRLDPDAAADLRAVIQVGEK